MGLGAGIAGGRTWGEGLSKGFQNAMTGRTLDQQHAAHSQTVAALMTRRLRRDNGARGGRQPHHAARVLVAASVLPASAPVVAPASLMTLSRP